MGLINQLESEFYSSTKLALAIFHSGQNVKVFQETRSNVWSEVSDDSTEIDGGNIFWYILSGDN